MQFEVSLNEDDASKELHDCSKLCGKKSRGVGIKDWYDQMLFKSYFLVRTQLILFNIMTNTVQFIKQLILFNIDNS